MKRGKVAANATKSKWEGATQDVRGLARDLLAVLAHAENLEIVLVETLMDLDNLADAWEQASEDNANRKYGPDLVQASDAAAVCATRVREITAYAREHFQELEEMEN